MNTTMKIMVIDLIISTICRTLPPLSACKFQAFILPILIPKRRGATIKFQKIENLLIANDGADCIYFYSPYRASRYIWPEGTNKIKKRMLSKYLPTTCDITLDNVIIDVGANIGEFSIAISEKASHVFSFEPDPIASKCLRANTENCLNISTVESGLGEKTGIETYYLSSRLADSSLIKPTQKHQEITINVITLDDFIEKNDVAHISLIKLEAEGAEPEIIRGATRALSITDSIAVDISPEREGFSTLNDVTVLLENLNFRIVKVTNASLFAIRKN